MNQAKALIKQIYHFDIHQVSDQIPKPVVSILIGISLLVPPLIIMGGFFISMPELNNFKYAFAGFSKSEALPIEGSKTLLLVLLGLIFFRFFLNAILAPIDLVVRAKREKKPIAWEDCFVFSLASVVIALAGLLIIDAPVAEWLRSLVLGLFSFLDNINPIISMPFLLVAVLVYFFDDIFFYIGHRLSHNVRFMWKLGHMQHHRPTNLTTATQTGDFTAFFLNGGGGSFVTSIIGKTFFFKLFSDVDTSTAIWGAMLVAVFNVINHTMSHSYSTYFLFSKYKPLAWLEQVFVTGRIHYVHHSKLPEHNVAAGCNFAAQFTFIDRIMGTYAKPSHEIPPTGLFHEPIPPGNPIKFALDQWIKMGRELYFNSPKHWPKILFADPSYEPPIPAYS